MPDQHAAFGITRAMERRREAVWRDLGMEGVVAGENMGGGNGAGAGRGRGRRIRVKESGRLMGGRRTVCLR